MSVAERALVTTRPTVADLRRVWATLELTGVASAVVITRARPGVALEAARKVLAGVAVCPVVFPLRDAIAADYERRPGPFLSALGAEVLGSLPRLFETRRSRRR
jgi:hypothetical protein